MKKRMLEENYEGEYNCYKNYKNKGQINFWISDKNGNEDSIFIKTEQLEDETYKTHLDVKEYNENFYHKNGEVYLNLYSENKLNIEDLFERLKEEYKEGSEVHYQKILEEFPTFKNPYKVEGDIKNTNSFIELKKCEDLYLSLSEDNKYNGNVRETYRKCDTEDSHSYSFYSNEREEHCYECILPNGNLSFEYKEKGYPKFETDKMRFEIKGNQIKFNDMTPEEMVKQGNFGNIHKFNIKSDKDLEIVSKRFYKKLNFIMNNNTGDIIKCRSEIQEKIIKNFEKSFNKIKNQMLKQENNKNSVLK